MARSGSPTFGLEEIKTGDKITMRKHWKADFEEYEVICNKFPACWLRMRKQEDGTPKSDSDFLIFYDDLLDEYDVKEVLSNEEL